MKPFDPDLLKLAIIDTFNKGAWYIILKRYKEIEKEADEATEGD